MLAVMIIPTGIGAAIGGHAGDATLAAKLLAGACDTLIVHPNVVNAADLNEMPENALYVEGSTLDWFLQGHIDLRRVRSNSILVACNDPVSVSTINCCNAAHSLLGMKIKIMPLVDRLTMVSEIKDGVASGSVSGHAALVEQAKAYDFDAMAIHTEIKVDEVASLEYLRTGKGVNPWGGVEAILSRYVSRGLAKPCAHAPIETNPAFDEVVHPALSPELISKSMLFCVLKGLRRAPIIVPRYTGLGVNEVDALVTPMCWGPPHDACRDVGIPIIMVQSNPTNVTVDGGVPDFLVSTYLEAAGVLLALDQGISAERIMEL